MIMFSLLRTSAQDGEEIAMGVASSLEVALNRLDTLYGEKKSSWIPYDSQVNGKPCTGCFGAFPYDECKVEYDEFGVAIFCYDGPPSSPAKTPAEIYALPLNSEYLPYSLYPLFLEDRFIPEIRYEDIAHTDLDPRIEFREVASKRIDQDHRNTLWTVWFDNKPVMICQQTYDNHDRFITDYPLYKEMVQYIKDTRMEPAEIPSDIYDINEPIRALTCFGSTKDILAKT